jgi:adhesin/invasin
MPALKAALRCGALLVAVASCDSNPAANANTTLVLEPDHLQLYVNESVQVVAQLMKDGHLTPGEGIVYWSDNTQVATVAGGDRVVTARLPGDTWIRARYGTVVDSIAVSVLPDTRGELQVLDIVPGEVTTATQTGAVSITYVALDGYGNTRCTPTGFSLRGDPFIVTTSVRTYSTACALVVTPGAEGETYVVATVKGLSDSVLVKVRNGAYSAQFTDSTVISAVAGAATPVTVRMIDPRGRPVPGQTVWFTAAPGLLDRTTAVTDADGRATVTWTPASVLAASGGSGQLTFRTLFPTGGVAAESRTVPLLGGAPVRISWFSGAAGRYPAGSGTLSAALNNYFTVSAAGRDRYGNQTTEAPVLTFVVLSGSAPSKPDDRGNTCAQNLEDPLGLARYTACYASYRFLADAPGTIRVYAAYAQGPRDSVDVTFR